MAFYYLSGLASNLLTASGVTFSGDADDSNFPHENIATGKPWEMMRFAAAGTDDYIHANRSSISPTFCSIHFHNIDSGITAIQLRRGASGGTLVATLTKASPSFFTTFAAVADTDWRLTFVGTNTGGAIYIGEWVLGIHDTLTRPQDWGWNVGYRMPQRRLESPAGLVFAHNLSEQSVRALTMSNVSTTDARLDEHLDMLADCAWGEEPLIVVPDSSRSSLVIHGRPEPDFQATLGATRDNVGFWRHGMTVLEDPGPIIVA